MAQALANETRDQREDDPLGQGQYCPEIRQRVTEENEPEAQI